MIKRHSTLAKKRSLRTRFKISTSQKRPRLTVFRSNKYISAQIIDDTKGITLVSSTSKTLKLKKSTKTKDAIAVGADLASKALKQKITHVVFDRGSYHYHGRIKSLADSARKQGLKF